MKIYLKKSSIILSFHETIIQSQKIPYEPSWNQIKRAVYISLQRYFVKLLNFTL